MKDNEKSFIPQFGEPEYIESGRHVFKVRQLREEDKGRIKACDALLNAKLKVEGIKNVLYALSESPSYGGYEFAMLGEEAHRAARLIGAVERMIEGM